MRVSRVGDRGGDSFQSPEQQRRRIAELARRHGYSLYRVVDELDVSGKSVERDGLDDAIGFVERGEASAIICYDLSRFGRNAAGVLKVRERLHALGGELILGDLETSDSVEGDTIVGIMATIAQGEHRRLSERFELSKVDAFERGVYLATFAPFGYRFDDDRRLVVVKKDARVVVELFELRAAGGSWRELVRLFARRTGRNVSAQTMRDTIKRRAYLGESPLPGEWRRSPKGHAAIVSVELFNAAQYPSASWRRASNRERFDGRAKSMLSGLARCAACGGKMHRTAGGRAGNLYYRCSAGCEGRVSVNAAALDEYVAGVVLEWAGEAADAPVEVEFDGNVDEARGVLVAELDDAEHELDVFTVGARGLDAARLEQGIATRQTRIDVARDALALFDATHAGAAERSIVRTTLRREWPGLTTLERRRLLAAVVDRVVVKRPPVANVRGRHFVPLDERVVVEFVAPAAVEQDAT